MRRRQSENDERDDDFDGGDAYEIVVDDAGNKKRVKKPVKAKQASWRSIESGAGLQR